MSGSRPLDNRGSTCYTLAAPRLMSHSFKSLFIFTAVLAALACTPPKFTTYRSPQGDYKVSVPWGWLVMNEDEGTRFTNANFIGPFEPDFYLGAPSMSVRWHAYYEPRRLPGGRLEMFAGVDDFILKPVDPEMLVATLTGLLLRHSDLPPGRPQS